MKKTFHIIILGLFIAQSLVLYVVEGMLPVPFIRARGETGAGQSDYGHRPLCPAA